MHAQQLLLKQIEETGNMLVRAIDGVSEAGLDHRVHPTMMSIREHLAHLCEAYVGFEASARGAKHEWGTYQPAETTKEALMQQFSELRARAITTIVGSDEEAILISGAGYIANHDAYHIGQIAATRQAFDPEWSSYSLYA
ncbi:MAG: DinB family protein [Fimbriimonadaceae bacterium]|nr:DinB family protein [Fimbriimonadaceae bacterium]